MELKNCEGFLGRKTRIKSADEIKRLAKKIRIKSSDATRERILSDAEAALFSSMKKGGGVLPSGLLRWRTIMKSRITRLAAAAVIVIAVMAGLHYYAGPIGVTSVAWAELVQRVEQSHEEYMRKLLSAVEEKDAEKVEFYADLLSEFWQKLGWLARAKLHPERQDQISASIAAARAHYEGRENSD